MNNYDQSTTSAPQMSTITTTTPNMSGAGLASYSQPNMSYAAPQMSMNYAGPQLPASNPNQNVANATYADRIVNAVTSSPTVPSTDIAAGITTANASAKRTSMESIYQDYLNQQQNFQNQYLANMKPSTEEANALARLKQADIEAARNQERALNSGETLSFAGGEAQRVARNDALNKAALAAMVDTLQSTRENAQKQLEFLINSSDTSFKNQIEIQKLKGTVNGVDKQAQDTFFNLAQQNPDVNYTYDNTKTAVENLDAFRNLVAQKPKNEFGTPQQIADNERALLSSFRTEPQVKNYAEILVKTNSFKDILNKKLGGPGDLALVYEFMKGLDPTSVVRETEYATAAKSGNIFAGAYTRFNGYLKPEGGFLPENVKKSFESIVDSKLKEQQAIYDQIKGDYQAIASRSGMNPENVVINYDKTQKYNQPQSTGAVVKTKIGEIRTDW